MGPCLLEDGGGTDEEENKDESLAGPSFSLRSAAAEVEVEEDAGRGEGDSLMDELMRLSRQTALRVLLMSCDVDDETEGSLKWHW